MMDNQKLTLDVKDLMSRLGIGRETAYALMHSTAFPSMRIGGRYLVSVEALHRWLQQNEGKEFAL